MNKVNWEAVIDCFFLVLFTMLFVAGFLQLLAAYGKARGIM